MVFWLQQPRWTKTKTNNNVQPSQQSYEISTIIIIPVCSDEETEAQRIQEMGPVTQHASHRVRIHACEPGARIYGSLLMFTG